MPERGPRPARVVWDVRPSEPVRPRFIWEGPDQQMANPDGVRRGGIRDIRTGPGAKIGRKDTSRGLPIGIGGRHLKDRALLVPDVSR